jgi:hypothetical protein
MVGWLVRSTTKMVGRFLHQVRALTWRKLDGISKNSEASCKIGRPAMIFAKTHQPFLQCQVNSSQYVQLEIELGRINDLPTAYSPSIRLELQDLALDGYWAHFAFLNESEQYIIWNIIQYHSYLGCQGQYQRTILNNGIIDDWFSS